MSFFESIRKLGRGLVPMSPDELLRPAQPIVLAAFDAAATPLASWKVVTDSSSLAGFSTGSFEQMRDENGHETFARFSGVLSKEVRAEGKRVRSGFAALQSPPFNPGYALGDLDHLRVRMRSNDNRAYVMNLRVDGFNLEDLYQGTLQSPVPGTWHTQVLPLQALRLTGRGRLRERQRKLDGETTLQSIGVLLADEKDGPFQLDIASISVHPSGGLESI